MEDNYSKLYKAMVNSGYDIADLGGSEEDFRREMQDSTTRKNFYDWVSNNEMNGFRIGSYDAYEERLAPTGGGENGYTLPADELGLKDETVEEPKKEDPKKTAPMNVYSLRNIGSGLPSVKSTDFSAMVKQGATTDAAFKRMQNQDKEFNLTDEDRERMAQRLREKTDSLMSNPQNASPNPEYGWPVADINAPTEEEVQAALSAANKKLSEQTQKGMTTDAAQDRLLQQGRENAVKVLGQDVASRLMSDYSKERADRKSQVEKDVKSYNDATKYVANPYSGIDAFNQTAFRSGATKLGNADELGMIEEFAKDAKNKILTDETLKAEVQKEANLLEMSLEDYVDKIAVPALQQRMYEEWLAPQEENAKGYYNGVMAAAEGSLIGMLLGATRTDTEKYLSQVGQEAWRKDASILDRALSGAGSMFLDLPIFGGFGSLASVPTKYLGGQVYKQLAKNEAKKLVAKGVTETAAQRYANYAVTNGLKNRILLNLSTSPLQSGLTFGMFDAGKAALSMSLNGEWDWSELGKSAGGGFLLGAALGGTNAVGGGVTAGLTGGVKTAAKIAEFGVENAVFTEGGRLIGKLHGQQPENGWWEDYLESGATLLMLKAPNIVKNVSAIKGDKEASEVFAFNELEREQLGKYGEDLNAVLESLLPQSKRVFEDGLKINEGTFTEEYRRVMSDPEVSMTTKAKLMGIVEGKVMPAPRVVDAQIEGNRVMTYDPMGRLVEVKEYATEAKANAEYKKVANAAEIESIAVLEDVYMRIKGYEADELTVKEWLAKNPKVTMERVAEIIAKNSAGEKLTDAEQKILESLRQARREGLNDVRHLNDVLAGLDVDAKDVMSGLDKPIDKRTERENRAVRAYTDVLFREVKDKIQEPYRRGEAQRAADDVWRAANNVKWANEDVKLLADRIYESDRQIDETANDGMIYTTTNNKGEKIIITGGKVVLDNEGYIDVNQSEGLVALMPDGTKKPVRVDELREKVEVSNADDIKAAKREEIIESAKVENEIAPGAEIEVAFDGEIYKLKVDGRDERGDVILSGEGASMALPESVVLDAIKQAEVLKAESGKVVQTENQIEVAVVEGQKGENAEKEQPGVFNETAQAQEDPLDAAIDAARNGDTQAAAELDRYGIDWRPKTVYRHVAKSEVDALINGETVNGRFGNGRVDVTSSAEPTTATSAEYRVTFKEDFDFGKQKNVVFKNSELGDGYTNRGYTLDDVAVIERRNEDGTYTVVYSVQKTNTAPVAQAETVQPAPKTAFERNIPVDEKGKKMWEQSTPEYVAEYIRVRKPEDVEAQMSVVSGMIEGLEKQKSKMDAMDAMDIDDKIAFWNKVGELIGGAKELEDPIAVLNTKHSSALTAFNSMLENIRREGNEQKAAIRYEGLENMIAELGKQLPEGYTIGVVDGKYAIVETTPEVQPLENKPKKIRGRKQVEVAIGKMRKADAEGNAIEALNQAFIAEKNVNLGDEGAITPEEQAEIDAVKQKYAEMGYEVVDLTGMEYDGDIDNLAESEQAKIGQKYILGDVDFQVYNEGEKLVVKSVVKPAIIKDGVIVQKAKVLIGPEGTSNDIFANMEKSRTEDSVSVDNQGNPVEQTSNINQLKTFDRTPPKNIGDAKSRILEIIEIAKKIKDKVYRTVVGSITSRQKEDFKREGLSVDESWVHSFENSRVIHENSHMAAENRKGQIPVSEEELLLIPDILENYDYLQKSPNKNKEGNAVVIYKKQYPDGTIYYLEEVRTRRKSLAFQSMYKKRSDSSDGLLNNGSTPSTSQTPSDNFASAGEGTTQSAKVQENTQKSGDVKPTLSQTSDQVGGQVADNAPGQSGVEEIQEPRSVEEVLENGDKRITNYNSRGEVATVATERDGKVVSVDSYDEGVLFEHTEYDGGGKAASVTRYDKQGNAIGTQVYVDGKAVPSGKQSLAEKVVATAKKKQQARFADHAKAIAEKVGEVTMPNLRENNTMHSVDVTPEMKESVMEGQTMFRRGDRNDRNFENKNITLHTTGDGRIVRYEQLELFDTDERTTTDIQRGASGGNQTADNRTRTGDIQRDGLAGGDALTLINAPLRPLEEGETSLVQRVFTKSKAFDFTAGEQIESLEDVAYIFKNLEDESIENSFAVLVKDGKPVVLHLGMGNYTTSIINASAVAVAMENVKPDKVYLVHNHPSGALSASDDDVAVLEGFRKIYGDIVEKGIIINLKSGKFGIYDTAKETSEERSTKAEGGADVPVETFTFNKQVFDKDFNPAELFQVKDDSDVAAFISSNRLGDRNKIGLLVCNNQNRVVGNVFTPFVGITAASAKKVAKEIVYYTTVMGGNRPVLFGRFPALSAAAKSNLGAYIGLYSGGTIKLLDMVDVESRESVLHEDEMVYGDKSVDNSLNVQEDGTMFHAEQDIPLDEVESKPISRIDLSNGPVKGVNEPEWKFKARREKWRRWVESNTDVKTPMPEKPFLQEGESIEKYEARMKEFNKELNKWKKDILSNESEIEKMMDILYDGKIPEMDPTPEDEFTEQVFKRYMGDDGIKVDRKSMRGMIMDEIIERRRKIETNNFDDVVFIDKVRKATTPEQRKAIPFIIEGTYNGKVTPELASVVNRIRDWFENVYQALQAADAMHSSGKIKNYVTHIWDKERTSKAVYENYINTRSKYTNRRSIETYAEGIALGMVPKYDDICDIMLEYGHVANEAIANKDFTDFLHMLRVDGEPVLKDATKRDPMYVRTSAEALDGYKVHKYAKGIVETVLGNIRTENAAEWMQKLAHFYDMTGSLMKKINLSLSFFHHGALIETAVGAMGPAKTISTVFKNLVWDCMKSGELPALSNPEAARNAVNHLVQLGATQDYMAKEVNRLTGQLKGWLQDFSDKHPNFATKSIVKPAELLDFLNTGFDKVLWDYLHDGLKIYTFDKYAKEIEEYCKKKGVDDTTKDMLLNEAGQFVNDTFGGQFWELINQSPATVKWMRRLLLSPDWTVSTIRQALAPLGFGTLYKDYEKNWFKRTFSGIPEAVTQRRKMGAKFWIIAMLTFIPLMNALNAWRRKDDVDEELKKAEERRKTDPEYKSPYELKYPEGMKWYDYTMYGNTIGHQTHLFGWRYDDDKEGYIRWGKQFRELPELFLGKDGFSFPGPMIDKMVGKANPALSASLAFLGYAKDGWQSKWMKDKKGWEKELGRVMMMASAFMPYSIPTDEDKEFMLTDLMMPSSKGFSNNKAIREFETAILAQDFDYVGAVYDACVMNKLDAEKLLQAAIARVEAQAKAEYVEGANTLNEAWDKYQEDLDVNEKRAVRAKFNKLLQENAYKDFEKQEARDMVQSVLDGTYREEKLPDAYVANETPDDVRDAYKMDAIRLRLKKVVDGLPEDAEAYEQYYKDNETKIDLYDEVVAARREINLIMEDIKMYPQQTEQFMQEIRDIRREIIELANNLTGNNE